MIPVNRTLTMAWIGLIVLTLVSFVAAETLIDRRIALACIFAIAALKGQMVASRFMEVGHALPHWNAMYRVWIVGIAIILVVGHII
jgi:heme/copper-type cytochrome/quinol oxidase subunit 4